MYERITFKLVLFTDIFRDGDVEVALDSLILLELKVCPLPLVHELFECLLQVFEDTDIRTLDLTVVDVDLCLQFLGMQR